MAKRNISAVSIANSVDVGVYRFAVFSADFGVKICGGDECISKRSD